MKNLKKIIVAASLCAAIGATAIAGTLAYFTDETETAVNTFTVGDLELTLDEVWNENDGLEIVPGRDIQKIPDVTLTGVDGFVRVKVEVVAKDPAQQEALNTLLENGGITIDYSSDWTYDGGYYYYNGILSDGETTSDLFTKVTISETLDDELAGISDGFDVKLTAYGVQEEGFEQTENESVLSAAKEAFAATFDKE